MHCKDRHHRHGERFARGEAGRGFGHTGPDHGSHRHGGRRGRMFDHGELRLVVLALIAEQPRHGYEIIKAIEERLAGSYSPSPGVIYPTLTMLEELGHATVAENGGKKQYSITEDGTAFLAANQPAVDAAMGRMHEAGAARGSAGAPQLVRAMENLKLSLRLRMERGPLTETQLRMVAEVLDVGGRRGGAELMAILEAKVPTQHASRYLQQLCKHWSHRFEVTFDPAQGEVRLNGAVCRFQADPARLVMTLEGPEHLERMSGVVTEHLKRFAFKEEFAVDWSAPLPSPSPPGRGPG